MNHVSTSVSSRSRLSRLGMLAGLLTVTVGLTACGGESAIDAPPLDVEMQMLQQIENNASGVQGTSLRIGDEQAKPNMTVYARDRYGYLAPIGYQWNAKTSDELAKAALELLIEGGSHAAKLPSDFKATIPKGTKVTQLSIKPEQQLAIVEFSDEFHQYKTEDERKVLESIVWTLTSLPDVKHVQLWMNGERLSAMPVGDTPIDGRLSRSFGINLERADGVSDMYSTPVTLYFTALTEKGKAYYVPITRLITPSNDPLTSTLEQMVAGPLNANQLSRVLTENTKIGKIEHKGDLVTVNLEDTMFEQGDKVPSELIKAVVLSLTERPDIGKVQVLVNGVKDITGTDNKNYSEPVSRVEAAPVWKG
ncbi:GerMN domain-containing protein [Paenibacillus assamensis]|uniref:GerMN domain-containing protein n=1 Tax=Paenibacillus assamensis TaxID=311244 RepID=UPI0003F57076|nr:GerMN domain-containing protein [Paenibacillus assamensis]